MSEKSNVICTVDADKKTLTLSLRVDDPFAEDDPECESSRSLEEVRSDVETLMNDKEHQFGAYYFWQEPSEDVTKARAEFITDCVRKEIRQRLPGAFNRYGLDEPEATVPGTITTLRSKKSRKSRRGGESSAGDR